jgi:hypothetical protein
VIFGGAAGNSQHPASLWFVSGDAAFSGDESFLIDGNIHRLSTGN